MATFATSGEYRSRTSHQSTPDMSSAQKWSRWSRQASLNICIHSLPGSTETRTRSRSSQPLRRLAPSSLSGGFSPALTTRRRRPER